MSQRPARIGAIACVPCVRRTGSISTLESLSHCRIGNSTAETTIPYAHEFSIPTGCWHPHFDLDIGITGGLQRGSHTAKSGQLLEERARLLVATGAGQREFTGGHGLRQSDRCVFQRQSLEALAGRRFGLHPAEERQRKRDYQQP